MCMFIKNWSEIDTKAPNYYQKIVELCKTNRQLPDNICFIVVDHCLQTFESHVNSLAQLGRVAGIILKSSTRVKEAEDFAKKYCKVLQASKESLTNPDVAIELLLSNTRVGEQLIILDHGGYFAPALDSIKNNPELSKRLLGVVEVTENGHCKQEQALKKTSLPLLSIARTEIKELEDIQVGESICDATNTIMYSVHAALSSIQNACIIGYGKIGRSIANNCRKRGIPEITVMEIDPLRAQLAYKDGHTVVMGNDVAAKKEVFRKTQVLFSATGAKALSRSDVRCFRSVDLSKQPNRAVMFIASCTSPDDEFQPDFFEELQNVSTNTPTQRLECEKEFKLTPFELFDGRKIYLLNGGKAVNFAIGGTPGYEICQVWASILFAAAKLAAKEIEPSNTVQSLTRAEQVSICKITHQVFFEKNDEPARFAQEITRQRSRSFSCSSTSTSLADTDHPGPTIAK